MDDYRVILQSEKQEWQDALADFSRRHGSDQSQLLLKQLLSSWSQKEQHNLRSCVTYYQNTSLPNLPFGVSRSSIAEQLAGWISWNTVCMVAKANRQESALGGHFATYQSVKDLYEVGFDYFFRGDSDTQLGDLIYYQGHSITGVYARSFLEGRFQESQLENYRRETQGQGLSSYPHPWLMPGYWQFPTVSMGLGPAMAIHQARLLSYLESRRLLPKSDRRVWAFSGDGEMLEPESTGLLRTAARDQLNRLVFVVSCNLLELDGLVCPNNQVITELEGVFIGAGWRVIKIIWNSHWEALFIKEQTGQLQQLMTELVDGELQNITIKGVAYLQQLIKDRCPELEEWVDAQPENVWESLGSAGHDWVKIHQAYLAAAHETDRPVCILAKTVKGCGLGAGIESVNSVHSKKALNPDELVRLGRQWQVPLTDEKMKQACFYHPGLDHPSIAYMRDKRAKLGGSIPARDSSCKSLPVCSMAVFSLLLNKSQRPMSTTKAVVRCLGSLLRQPDFRELIVPIVPDEARTFGMEGLFKQIGIYAPGGQQYTPHDIDNIAGYREATDGQFIQEGLCEAGGIATWIAAATAYAHHKVPLIPFYVFYSMFGFQRIGDFIWAAADSRARGFLIGATSGRTTLEGEGLQHNDGHSHVLSSVVPRCVSYDPCFAYECAVIIQHGLKRMYTDQEDVFYYMTVMNESYEHPAILEGAEQGIIKGMYSLDEQQDPDIHFLASGAILRESMKAAAWMKAKGIRVKLWSVTSFTELRREGLKCERDRLIRKQNEKSWTSDCLQDGKPVVAASDYMRSVADQIRFLVPGDYAVCGTDGFGRSDSRERMRDYFEVSSNYICWVAIDSLLRTGIIKHKKAAMWQSECAIDVNKPNPAEYA